jgi:transglutaminase-like putative cysteine protease
MTTVTWEADWVNNGGSASLTIPTDRFAWQERIDIQGDTGWTLKTYANGDEYLYHSNPGSSGTIRAIYEVHEMTFADIMATPGEPVPSSRYLGSDTYVNPNNSECRQVAAQIRAENEFNGDLARLTNKEKWAIAEDSLLYAADLTFKSMGSNEGSDYAFANNSGDCTEFAAMFTALARANGLHAGILNNWWDSNGDGNVNSSWPTHADAWVYLPDGDSDGVKGEGHKFLVDPNLHGLGKGFDFRDVNDTKIWLNDAGQGVYTWSSFSDVNYNVDFG